ncbi:MAG: ATP-dependent DNA helicase RecG [Bacteroidia bacterium]|nr:ATP-dependent DNA helicase RecG [Bacteroidia bacterium]
MLEIPVEYVKGVGSDRAKLLQSELGISTVQDLLYHFPFRYVDRTRFYLVSEAGSLEQSIQLKGRLRNIRTTGGRKERLEAEFYDQSGSLELVWFAGIKWVKPLLVQGMEYVVFGKPGLFNKKLQISHPEIQTVDDFEAQPGSFQPVYTSTEKLKSKFLDSKGLSKLVQNALKQFHRQIPETLTMDLMYAANLISLSEALVNVHVPKDSTSLSRAIYRLKFEELFFIQLFLCRQNLLNKKEYKGFVFQKVGQSFNDFYNHYLPFPLTNAQKRVIKEIRHDIGSGKQMNRLLQGDVGSGKTVVALMSMLIAKDNGFQSCLMAPTEILAKQHFLTLRDLLQDMPVHIALLTGSTKKKDRNQLHQDLQSGLIDILIGTHALIEDEVKFANLGFVVIDEQHRFGVAQRAKLWKKNISPPHVLIMSATPIPRTLALTLYGDLDVSVIDELPPGRKPIQTIHYYEEKRLRLFGFLKEQIHLGRQVYIVYPLIEESETLDLNNLMEGFEAIQRAFPPPQYRVGIVHGRQAAADKDFEMQRFQKGETNILVSTTVIEVGVNVPNASVMVIENAERFGLSQLHQLRGRVGRGADQSYCILMSSYKLSSEGKTRLETMVRTNDGFEIAEVDLKLRGPGDMGGTRQSGVEELKIADLVKDNQLLLLVRQYAEKVLSLDPNLSSAQNAILYQRLEELQRGRVSWKRIS